MVEGLNTFRHFFAGDEDKYVLIGGTACDVVFSDSNVTFRATRDLDMVLIVEALTPDFGEKIWRFIDNGGYKNKKTSSGKPQFFRFTEPVSPDYPAMIELFARTEISLRDPSVLTPIHIDDEISSLSGILLDEDYYRILLEGRTVIDGLSVLKP
jgi:glutathionyl-hydroquinone reductase